jgi:ketosteroid isomerase-like protein
MTHKNWLLPLILCLPTLASSQNTQVCTATAADKPAVAKTVESIFAAAQAESIPAFNAVVTPDFYMFDTGKRFEGHAIMDLIIAQHKKGFKYEWTVPNPDVEVGCNEAWIAYENVGSVTTPDGKKKDLKWLESAVLIKTDGQWRIRFFHSTQAE